MISGTKSTDRVTTALWLSVSLSFPWIPEYFFVYFPDKFKYFCLLCSSFKFQFLWFLLRTASSSPYSQPYPTVPFYYKTIKIKKLEFNADVLCSRNGVTHVLLHNKFTIKLQFPEKSKNFIIFPWVFPEFSIFIKFPEYSRFPCFPECMAILTETYAGEDSWKHPALSRPTCYSVHLRYRSQCKRYWKCALKRVFLLQGTWIAIHAAEKLVSERIFSW